MEEIALGRFMIDPGQFDYMTPRRISNIIRGRAKKEEDELKERWELHRREVMMSLSPHLSKTARKKSYSELYPFPWENKKTKQTKEEVKEFWEKIDKRTDKIKNNGQ